MDLLSRMSSYLGDDKDVNDRKNTCNSLKQKAEEEQKKVEEAEKKRKESRKKELLAKTNKYVDKVTQDIMFVPKPHGRDLNIKRNGIIFYPYLRGEMGNTVFKLLAGFNQSDWIFTDEITCNADGYIFSIVFDSLERQTEVGFGTGIYEWIEVVDLSFDSMFSGISNNPNLLEDLKKLSKAKKAMVKFKGQNYARDYTLNNLKKISFQI